MRSMSVIRGCASRAVSSPWRRRAVWLIALLAVVTIPAGASAQVERLQAQVVVDRAYRAVLQVRLPRSGGIGSGTIISPAGYVLTNYHVIAEGSGIAAEIEVWRQDGRFEPLRHAFNATFVRGDAQLDLAVLRIVSDANGQSVSGDFEFFPIGDFRALGVKLTDRIDAIGFPAAGGSSMTSHPGTISGFLAEFDTTIFARLPPNPALWTDREEQEFNRRMLSIQAGDAWIKTDALFTGGISGGALLDATGVLIGVPTLRIRDLRLARPAIAALPLLEGLAGVVVIGAEAAATPLDAPSDADVLSPPTGETLRLPEPPPLPDDTEVVPEPPGLEALAPGQEEALVRRIQNGGVVVLGSGTFELDATLEVTRPLVLIGAGMDATVIRVTSEGGAVRWANTVNNTSLVIRDLTVEHRGPTGSVLFLAGEEAELRGVRVRGGAAPDGPVGGRWFSNGSGLHVSSGSRVSIHDSQIANNAGNGIFVTHGSNVTVFGSVIADNGSFGVFLGDYVSPGGLPAGAVWRGSTASLRLMQTTVRGNGDSGILFTQSTSGVIAGGSTITGNLRGVEDQGSGRVEIRDSFITSNRGVGVALSNDFGGEGVEPVVGSPILERNEIADNGDAGVFAYGFAKTPRIVGNAVSGNRGFGLVFADAVAADVDDNTIAGNALHGVQATDRANVTLRANRIYENRQWGIIAYGESTLTVIGDEVGSSQVVANDAGGIALGDRARARIVANTINGNGGPGILFEGRATGSVDENTITNNAGFGISMPQGGYPSIGSNTMSGNTGGSVHRSTDP